MSTERQQPDLSEHYFIKYLENKKSYRIDKLAKIEKLKQKKKEELTKEQIVMIERQNEEKEQLQYFNTIEKMFVEATEKELKKHSKSQQANVIIASIENQLGPIENLVRLYNQERLFNLANELVVSELSEIPFVSIREKTEEKYNQIFTQI